MKLLGPPVHLTPFPNIFVIYSDPMLLVALFSSAAHSANQNILFTRIFRPKETVTWYACHPPGGPPLDSAGPSGRYILHLTSLGLFLLARHIMSYAMCRRMCAPHLCGKRPLL